MTTDDEERQLRIDRMTVNIDMLRADMAVLQMLQQPGTTIMFPPASKG